MSWRIAVAVLLGLTLGTACTVTPSPVPVTNGPSIVPTSPSPTQTPSSTPVAIASATPPEATPDSTPASAGPTMPAFPGPALLVIGGVEVPPSHQGGCPSVHYLGEWVTGDQCGPNPYDLDAPSTLVAPAASLVFTTPAGWAFSAEDLEVVGSELAWQVTIAPVSDLDGLPTDRQESIYLSAVGQALGAGDAPAATIGVVGPTKPGDYLLELRAYIARDGWTLGASLYHWRLSIG